MGTVDAGRSHNQIFGRIRARSAGVVSGRVRGCKKGFPSGGFAASLRRIMANAKPTLSGRRVVLTRADGANETWRVELERRGALVLEVPLIAVELGADPASTATDVLETLGTYEWIVFTSANGVRGFFKSFFAKYKDIRCLGPSHIACVGKATAAELDRLHIQTDLLPDEAEADALATALMEADHLENLKILVVAGNLAGDTIARRLTAEAQAIVDTFVVYETREADADGASDVDNFREQGADALIFASPSAVKSFVSQLARLKPQAGAKQPKVVAIGATTASAVRQSGIPLAGEADAPSAAGVADAVEKLFR